jgi:hypothetical protein
MAPEVIEHKPYDEKADVFSFAVVLWELLTCKVGKGEGAGGGGGEEFPGAGRAASRAAAAPRTSHSGGLGACARRLARP